MLNARGKSPGRLSLTQADDHSLAAVLQLMRVQQKLQRQLERVLEGAGLTLPQFDVLANLGMSEGITQQELAQRLLVTKGNVCGLLDRMETAELVQRRPDLKDRRANRIFLTRQGRAALQASFPTHLTVIQESMGVLTAAEQRTLAHLLSRIKAETPPGQ